MAYLYIDDGHPESEDYENNYIYFNGTDPACIQKMVKLAQTLATLPASQKIVIVDKVQLERKRVQAN